MKVTERTALTKIINSRFDILGHEIDEREEEIAEIIRKRILDEARDAIPQAKGRVTEFIARAQKLKEEFLGELESIKDELGVVPGHTWLREERVYDDDDWRRQRRGAAPKIKVRRFAHQDNGMIIQILINDNQKWTPPDVEKRTQEELRKLGLDAKKARRSLEKKRLDLQEQLLLGALESQSAKDFLERIPSIEKLMPMPEQDQIEG